MGHNTPTREGRDNTPQAAKRRELYNGKDEAMPEIITISISVNLLDLLDFLAVILDRMTDDERVAEAMRRG